MSFPFSLLFVSGFFVCLFGWLVFCFVLFLWKMRVCKTDLWTVTYVQFERTEKNRHPYCFSLKCICQWLLPMTAGTWGKLKCYSFASLKDAFIQIYPKKYCKLWRLRLDLTFVVDRVVRFNYGHIRFSIVATEQKKLIVYTVVVRYQLQIILKLPSSNRFCLFKPKPGLLPPLPRLFEENILCTVSYVS